MAERVHGSSSRRIEQTEPTVTTLTTSGEATTRYRRQGAAQAGGERRTRAPRFVLRSRRCGLRLDRYDRLPCGRSDVVVEPESILWVEVSLDPREPIEIPAERRLPGCAVEVPVASEVEIGASGRR
jgi:hypothetical protein